MASFKDYLDAAKVLAGIAAATTATGPLGGMTATLNASGAAHDLAERLGRKPGLTDRIARAMADAVEAQRLSDDHRALVRQMTEAASVTATQITACARDPERIAEAMLVTLTSPDHRDSGAMGVFRRTVVATMTGLLADKAVLDELRPEFEAFVLASHQRQEANDARTHADLADIKKMIGALATPPQARGVPEDTVITIARRINADVADPCTALRELERAVDIAANVIAEGLRGSNLDAVVDEVLKRLAQLTAEGRLPDARAEAARALAEARDGEDKARARRLRLLDAMIEQDVLARDAGAVADRLMERLALDSPDPSAWFAALREIGAEWYERGRNMGLAFELEVVVELAGKSLHLASNADERGSALNNLGVVLQTLGEHESGTNRLEASVAALRAALTEFTCERGPLRWAAVQMNLGNSLAILGGREAGTAQLVEAVAAYRAALTELTFDRSPSKWADVQMNLGNALWAIGDRELGTTRLEEAVAAFRAALTVITRDRGPLDWARTQSNLGIALEALGRRVSSIELLEEAVAASRAALLEMTRDRVPLEWARVQLNLGNALQALGERERGTAHLEEAVAVHRASLVELTHDRMPIDWARVQVCLGNTLQTLGQREPGTARLKEAVAAYFGALTEFTRDGFPLYWATVQMKLGMAELAYYDKVRSADHLDRAEGLILAACEVFDAAAAGAYRDDADRLFAAIAARRKR